MRVEASMEFVLMLKKINRFKITYVDIPKKIMFLYRRKPTVRNNS